MLLARWLLLSFPLWLVGAVLRLGPVRTLLRVVAGVLLLCAGVLFFAADPEGMVGLAMSPAGLVAVVVVALVLRGRGRRGVGRGRVVGGVVGAPGRPGPLHGGGGVVVVAGRGGRAVRGVAGRLGRGARRLEVVGGAAVGNVAEGRLPWRQRAVVRAGLWAYIQPMAWLERQPWLRNRRAVDELRGDVEGQVGWAPTWVPGERRPPWREAADQLHRDVDRR